MMIDTTQDYANAAQHLADGRGVVFYEMHYPTAKQRNAQAFPQADYWYTERNGDPIGLLVPKGTDPLDLPNHAMSYIVIEWIDPDGEFNTGKYPTLRPGDKTRQYAHQRAKVGTAL